MVACRGGTRLALAPAALAVAAPAPAATVSQPVLAAEPVLNSPNGNGSAAALLADPLGAVILDLAEGKGRLTGQELKRLEVFRPEQNQLAVETVQFPAAGGGRSGGDAPRPVKLYAATLELRSKWAAQMGLSPSAGLPDMPYSARDFKLKMARDIMSLPTSDRSEVIGFLLGGRAQQQGKRPRAQARGDRHPGAPAQHALVNVLLDCLDDPDPIVQEYALAAADRLLGDS